MGLFFFCSAVGPVIGGLLHPHAGELTSRLDGGTYQVVFGTFFATNVRLVLLVLVAFRETRQLNPEKQLPSVSFRGIVIDPTLEPIKLVARSPRLRLLAAIYGFCYFGFSDRSSLLSLYATKHPFSMSHTTLGWFLSAQGMMRSVAVFAVLKMIVSFGRHWYGDHRSGMLQSLMLSARIGVIFAVVLTASFGLARDTLTLFALATIEGLDAMCAPPRPQSSSASDPCLLT